MIEIAGKYNNAVIYTDLVDQSSISQIIELCNQEFCKDSNIRIMPDVHAGEGCTIGTTMTLKDKVVPNLVGVDIGCGMEVQRLKEKDIDLELVDKVIRNYIPSGFNIREKTHNNIKSIDFTKFRCYNHFNETRAALSMGTLGGGNHFIEIDRDKAGHLYLVIHSGSRHLGTEIAKYYQEEAYNKLCKKCNQDVCNELINKLKSEGRQSEISSELKKLKLQKVVKTFAYCEGDLFEDYLLDMVLAQHYARMNRISIAEDILKFTGLTLDDRICTIHNYIDVDSMILRKGAVSAKQGEELLIPINMRDGSLLCIGKGNSEWNYSAPHGAGRLMSRSDAKRNFTVEEFTKEMEGIYTTSANSSTLDECPMAYKPIESIVNNIKDTVEIIDIIKPIYNFKAGEETKTTI